MIKLIDIKKCFKNYNEKTKNFELLNIIENLSIDIEEKSVIGLYGNSGIGKTTLLNIIAKLDNNYEGRIEGNYEISYDFQEDRLLEWFTTYENLNLIFKDKNITDYWLEKFNITHLKNKNINLLSGGEKRKIALVRALGSKANLILLDEPFSGIDKQNVNNIISIIKEYQQKNNKTIIIISHNIDEEYKLCDKIYEFEDGMKIKNIYNVHEENIESIIKKSLN